MKLSKLASTTVRNDTSPRPSTLAKRFETASKIEGVAITAPIITGDEAGGRVDLQHRFRELAKLFASRPRTANEQMSVCP